MLRHRRPERDGGVREVDTWAVFDTVLTPRFRRWPPIAAVTTCIAFPPQGAQRRGDRRQKRLTVFSSRYLLLDYFPKASPHRQQFHACVTVHKVYSLAPATVHPRQIASKFHQVGKDML